MGDLEQVRRSRSISAEVDSATSRQTPPAAASAQAAAEQDQNVAAARRLILQGKLEVNPATYMDELVPDKLAIKIRDRLNQEIAKNPAIRRDVPELQNGVKVESEVVNNSFAIAVSRFQQANGILARSPDGSRKASGSVDGPTYRALFREEFPLKAPSVPRGAPEPALGGFRKLADSTFYQAGDIHLQTQPDGSVRFYRNYPNAERINPSETTHLAVVVQGDSVRAERIATKVSGSTQALAYSADGWGGAQSATDSIPFGRGSIREQLSSNGFTADPKEPSVFRRNLFDSKGNNHEVVAVADRRSLLALMLPFETPAHPKPEEISRPVTRRSEDYRTLSETFVRVKTADASFEVVGFQGRLAVRPLEQK